MKSEEIVMVILSIFCLVMGSIIGVMISNEVYVSEQNNLGDEMCNHEGLEFSKTEMATNYKGENYKRIVCKDVEHISNDYLIKE